MQVEGKGFVPPTPVCVALSAADLAAAREAANRIAEYRRYSHRLDQWGYGLNPNGVLAGLVGERALDLWARRVQGQTVPPDWSLKPTGDRGTDLVLGGYRVQVKTGSKDYRELLVKTDQLADPADDDPRWHIIVRAQWPVPSPPEGEFLFDPGARWNCSVCELRGWVFRQHFIRHAGKPQSARKGTHFNYVLQPQYFEPMSDLAKLMDSRRGRGNL